VKDFTTIDTLALKKSYPPHLWGRTSFWTVQPPGHKPLVVNIVVVGQLEEEEDWISITSKGARGMALAPEPLRTTRSQPETMRFFFPWCFPLIENWQNKQTGRKMSGFRKKKTWCYSGHPRLSKGGQGEEGVCDLGWWMFPLGSLVMKLWDRNDFPISV